ncbi:hypothetical protein HRI_002384500 [Hibiscus trionum]|uniref:Reverse transcriptase domain-containing protein n=1 Tax=Hibiscus trionum TaxID=183268 RepID=A0A9W7M2H3_HIBTR|nr:hypothetical protein HRI_002384500 [Hibiscus trionum]
MEEITSENQFAFTKGRQILDCVLIANEAIDYVKRLNLEGVVFKVDFQRAYDTISWDFLDLMLTKFGFGDRWRKWLQSCISTASISILINGSPTDNFRIQRGLRQGCPLSPLIYNIVAEGLSLVLAKASKARFFSGVKIGSEDLEVTHLQFADDLIIFSGASFSEICNIKRIM